MRKPVDLDQAYRLLNHGPVVLIGSAWGERRNVMSAAWVMPLDFAPPKVAAVIDKTAYTRELIAAAGEFSLNIPCRAMADQVMAAGSCSGREEDKLGKLGLRTFAGGIVGAPLIEGCVAWLECRVLPHPDNEEEHDLMIAEVVAAQADERAFSRGRWHFTDPHLRTLHYFGGGSFAVTGEAVKTQSP